MDGGLFITDPITNAGGRQAGRQVVVSLGLVTQLSGELIVEMGDEQN